MNHELISDNRNTGSDARALMVAAEWLSGLFIAPLSQQQVADACAAPGQEALRWIGSQLGASAVAESLCHVLEHESPESLTMQLQRRYTALFEGILCNRAVLPYESAWCGESSALDGESVADMNAILRDLDVHISDDCCEPADHLAIELAALVTALVSGQNMVAADLVRRLQSWVPAFAEALQQQDPDGFYAGAGELSLALIRTAQAAPLMTDPGATPVNEQG